MIGAEFYYFISEFLQNLWWDVSHVADAELFSLAFRLIIFFVVVRILYAIVTGIFHTLWQWVSKFFKKILHFLFFPIKQIKKILARKKRKREEQKRQEAWVLQQKKHEQEKALEKEAQQKQLDEILKQLDVSE